MAEPWTLFPSVLQRILPGQHLASMIRWTSQPLLAATTLSSLVQSSHVLNLSDVQWTLSNPALNISVPAKLPSQAHLDLYAANVIGDPYYGLNDFNLRWVAWSNWTYTSAPLTNLNYSASTWLLFNGLDTFASISFCGEHVAATNNQFRQYWFDVSELTASCTSSPVLSINFGSAPMIANDIAAEPGQETWPYGVQIPFEFPNRQFIRKEGSDFGWDWGPAFAPAGPWQPAYIVQLGEGNVHVRNSMIDVYRQGQVNNLPPDQTQSWVLNASIDYFGSVPKTPTLDYTLMDANNETIRSGSLDDVRATSDVIEGSVTIPADEVALWWPNGLGSQPLYHLTITVVAASGLELASVEKRIGFRTIVLNGGPVTEDEISLGIAPGNHWHFEVNGYEFYAKGSNFIPPDTFWPRVTEARIRQLFDSVRDGGQNMLRVWSTGAYSPEFMYDVADEYGILLWSEFEFGDALYPTNEEFLDNVREEAVYQVRRVNHHPSLAYWAGGNELENLELATVRRSAPNQLDRLIGEYEALFLNVLVPALFSNSRSISYSPSSSGNGYMELNFSRPVPIIQRYDNVTEGHVYGNTDYYNYNSAVAFNTSTYPIGRFSNEFGYHSMPSLQTWRQAVSPSDLYFNSSVIQLRNHHYPASGLNTSNFANTTKGMGEMTIAAQRWYPVPNKTDSIANFSSWCHTTQIFQADFYKSQIQFYRRGSGMPERQLGSLYWQLEDIWQAPTWAGIEYDGRWKVLHYTAKDIYQNVIISPFHNVPTGHFAVYVTSDLWSTATGTANLTWYNWSGNKLPISASTPIPISVGGLNTTLVYETNLTQTLTGHNPADLLMILDVAVQGTLPNNNITQTFTHQNFFHPTPLSASNLVDPNISLTHDNESKTFTVEANSAVSVWTWLDYPSGAVLNFDDNAFVLLPGEKKTVGYTVKSDTTGGAWREGVTVGSLWDNNVP